jgi:hypothetical protein
MTELPKSNSWRFVVALLKKWWREERQYAAARKSALARLPFLKADGNYLSREEAHGRAALR